MESVRLLAVSRSQTELIKVGIAAAAVILALMPWLLNRLQTGFPNWTRGLRAALWVQRLLLFLTVIAALLNYSRTLSTKGEWKPAGLRYVWQERVDTYDLIHYYLNAKYFDELGYFRLYPACILADLEADGPFFFPYNSLIRFQTEENYYEISYQKFVADKQAHKEIISHFSPQRWQDFIHDFTYLQRTLFGLDRTSYSTMLSDHGFNGTPAWVALVQPLVQNIPVESVKLLCYLDVLLLAASALLVCWALGAQAAAFLLIFLFGGYSTRWPTLSWAFGRYDYLAAIIGAVALTKKSLPVLSGACLAVAAALRVFPLLWLWGPAVQAAYQLIKKRSVSAVIIRLFAGFVIASLLLQGLAAYRLGLSPIRTHLHNMRAHTATENLSSMRTGFALAAAYRGESNIKRIVDDDRIARIAKQSKWRVPLAIIVVLLLGYAVRKAKPFEALALGVIPFFFLATASYYYYAVRASLIIMHAADLKKFRNALGLALLFAIEAAVNGLQYFRPEYRVQHIGWLSWGIAAYALIIIAFFTFEARLNTPERASSQK